MDVLQQINTIIDTLQADKWENHGPAMLISAQGKLASYMSNLGGMVANAEYEFRLKEINHKQYETERYFLYRDEGQSQMDAKSNARVDAFAKEKGVYEAKRDWHALRAILKATESLSVACSTTLKHQQIDRTNSNYQENS